MATTKISAKRQKTGQTVEADFDMPDDLDTLVSKYGKEIVYSHAKGSLVVALQGFMRGQLDRNKSAAEVQTAVADWKPGQRKQGKSPVEKAREQIANLSPEEKAAILKELRSNKAGGAEGAQRAA